MCALYGCSLCLISVEIYIDVGVAVFELICHVVSLCVVVLWLLSFVLLMCVGPFVCD